MAAGQPITEAARAARSANLRAGREARQQAMRDARAQDIAAGKLTCSACHRILELAAYHRDASKGGYRYECRDCHATRRRELAMARTGRRLRGWVTRCCSAPLILMPGAGWLIVHDRRRCRERCWQPSPSGGTVGKPGA